MKSRCEKCGFPLLNGERVICGNKTFGSYKWRCSDVNCATPCTLDVHCKGIERPHVCPYVGCDINWEKLSDNNSEVKQINKSKIDNPQSKEYQIGVLRNIKREFRCKKTLNWAFVQKFLLSHTNHAGSNSSIEHCLFLGIDPDRYEF